MTAPASALDRDLLTKQHGALLTFDYGGVRVDPRAAAETFETVENGELVERERAFELEQAAARLLAEFGLEPSVDHRNRAGLHLKRTGDDDSAWLLFVQHAVPRMRQLGWRVELDPSFRYRVVKVGDWQLDIAEREGGRWLDVGLGIDVEGERVDLLPLLVSLLRELGDDMGLGKTVQALAHLLVEQDSGRADRPSLVVAPTSLMFNWRREAARFAPSLKVLLLHGVDRRSRFKRLFRTPIERDGDELRQVCCDPRLVALDSARKVKGSAKLDLLMALLPELLEEGRRVLLFSQFTSMLALIEVALAAIDRREGRDYVKLTGRTDDRQTPVDRFQSGQVPLFLISLKAAARPSSTTVGPGVRHDPRNGS